RYPATAVSTVPAPWSEPALRCVFPISSPPICRGRHRYCALLERAHRRQRRLWAITPARAAWRAIGSLASLGTTLYRERVAQKIAARTAATEWRADWVKERWAA